MAGREGLLLFIIFNHFHLIRIPVGELRHLAADKHGIKNAGLLRKPDLLEKLREHFESRHGLELQDDKEEDNSQEVSPISQTIDKLRSRIKVSYTHIQCVSAFMTRNIIFLLVVLVCKNGFCRNVLL